MTDVLDEVAGFRARSTPPDLDALPARHRPAPPHRRAGAWLAVAAAIAVVAAGVVLASREPSSPGPAATTTASTSTSAPGVGLAREIAVTATPSEPIVVSVVPLAPEVPRVGWHGGGSSDVSFTNVTDEPVVLVQPDWDAEGDGVVGSFPCEDHGHCQPRHLGADVAIAPGTTAHLNIWFEPTEVGTWERTFTFGWRVPEDAARHGSGTFTLVLRAVEAPLADPHAASTTTTMPR